MKKFMNLLVLGLALFLPFSVNAAESSIVLNNEGQIDCNPVEGKDNVYSCEVKVNTTGTGKETKLAVKLKEENATIDQNSIQASGNWMLDSSNYPTLVFESMTDGETGQYTLFTFEYQKATDGTDCYVSVNLVNPGADNKDTPTEPTPDTPEENKQTGMTLPYVVLGGAVLLAGYAFVSTKNKSKLHKI